MRTILISAALAFGAATPSVALAQNGHVDVSYANFNEDFGVGDVDIDITRVAGQVAFDNAPVGFQVDANYANWEVGNDLDAWGLGGHVYRRSLRWLFGGYVGFDSLDDDDAWTAALETQYYMPRGTFSGQLSYSDMEDQSLSSMAIDGWYRHFVTENFSVRGGAGLGEFDAGGTDFNFWQAEIGGEFKFDALPISVFAGYRHAEYDIPVGQLDTDTATVGVRYNWGGSLLDRDRGGPGLDRVLPVFERVIV